MFNNNSVNEGRQIILHPESFNDPNPMFSCVLFLFSLTMLNIKAFVYFYCVLWLTSHQVKNRKSYRLLLQVFFRTDGPKHFGKIIHKDPW